MGKVVTSQGLTEFVQEGKFTNVPDHKAKSNGEAPPLEVIPDAKSTELSSPEAKPAEPAEKTPEAPKEMEGLEDGDKEFPERVQKRINAKHRAMKEAQEAAAEAERFAELQFNEKRLLEDRARALQDRVKELEAKSAPAEPEKVEEAPRIESFRLADGNIDWDKFTDAKADYAANKAVAAERKRQADEQAAKDKAAAEARVTERLDKVRKVHPDFDTVLESIKGTAADQVPQHVLNYLFESDNGGELHYYLMKHPEETVKISGMKPILALAELGKLEERITKPVETPKSGTPAPVIVRERGGAPPPITPLSGEGNSGIQTDPAKMSYKELRAYERARARNKH